MAGGNIKGITISFAGDTTKLDKALRDISKNTKSLDNELKQVDKALKFNPSSVELWSQKQKILTEKISETEKRLDALKQAKEKADKDPNIDKESAEYRQLCRDIEITENQLKNFNKQLKQVGNVKLKALSEQFKQVGQKMTNAGKNLSQKVTAPLAAIGAVSLKAGMDFDTAMSQVAATSGKTVDEIQELRDFAKEMGSTTAFSATQAAEGLNYMALAGYDAETSMAMLPTVLDLAAAGAMELGAASDMVTDAQTALGLSCEETSVMVDQMAKASSQSNTSVAQLGEAILKVGPTAKNLAGGTNELSQVLGLLADNGIKGSEAGTHLRNIMLAMTPQTDKAAQAWEDLGVSAYDAEGNLRPMEDTFADLRVALKDFTAEERTEMLTKMFNKTDLASVNALLDTSAERWTELGAAIDDSAGAAGKMADTQLDNMAGSLTLLKSALEGAGIAISDVLAPVVRILADALNAIVTKFNELSPTAQKIIVTIGAVAAAIGPVLVILGILTSSIGSIIGLVGTVGPAVAGVVAAMGPVVLAIGAVIAVGVLLYKNWDKIKAKAVDLKNKLVKTFNDVKSKITTIWNNIKTTITNAVTNFSNNVKSKINALKTTVTSVFNKIKDAITKPIEKAKEVVQNAINKIKSIVNGAHLKLPKFKLPHFRINGGKLPWGIGGKGTPPSINVDWYAKGGIFNSPSVIGVGEAGSEAVVPLDKLWDKLDKMQGGETNIVININGSNKDPREIAEEVKRVLIRETNQRRLAWQ